MVKKLTKQEIISYIRSTVPFSLIFLGISVLFRIIQIFESDTKAYGIMFYSSLIAFIISLLIVIIMSVVNTVARFYKNLFSPEGYLTFTLPVTADQIISSKLIGGMLLTLFSVFVALIGTAIATSGDVLNEVIKAISFILKTEILPYVSKTNLAFYFVELIILIIFVFAKYYLLFYACASLGQTAKKSRGLAGFGYYFLYYIITQFIGTVFIIIATVFDWEEILRPIFEFIINHAFASLHIVLIALILFFAVFSMIYYFIVRYIIKNKLNLE